jgi:hypothetical protein
MVGIHLGDEVELAKAARSRSGGRLERGSLASDDPSPPCRLFGPDHDAVVSSPFCSRCWGHELLGRGEVLNRGDATFTRFVENGSHSQQTLIAEIGGTW